MVSELSSLSSSAPARLSLHDLSFTELEREIMRGGLRAVHTKKLWGSLHRLAEIDPTTRTDFPPPLQRWIASGLGEAGAYALDLPEVSADIPSCDGLTRKLLLRLADGQTIETVVMRYTGRHTACLSTQAGCAMGCVFCATGQMGFVRHLRVGEIVAQVLHAQRVLREPKVAIIAPRDEPNLTIIAPRDEPNLTIIASRDEPNLTIIAPHDEPKATHERQEGLRNLVLMGMGEPLHNYDAVIRALDIITDTRGSNIGPSRISISTVGVVPGILRLAEERRPYHLAVSLHAATEAERSAIMPANKRWPLAELMAACRTYCERTERKIFIEWTLIAGRNDTPEIAAQVAALLDGVNAHVNLIPLNPTAGFEGAPSDTAAADIFQAVLQQAGYPCTIRQRRGIDVAAGCGQLRAEKTRRER